MAAYFNYTLTREAEHEDAEDAVHELEVSATATGYDNTDVGGGGPNELDDWEVTDWDGLEGDLTSAEEELISEAAQEALNDS